MYTNSIDDALDQVRRMRALVLERRRFHGYSGKARMLCGTVALLATFVLASSLIPAEPVAHLLGWMAVLAVGVVVNYGAVAYWFLFDPEARRNPATLAPAVEALPTLAVGAALSAAALARGQYDVLFGIWMALYGLAQLAYRQSLPNGIYRVGLGYILAGVVCLIHPAVAFTRPWPMGLVFFVGEWAGGLVLCLEDHRCAAADTAPRHTGDSAP